MTDDEYDALTPTSWPVRVGGQAGGRLFADGGFSTPDRKARFLPTPWIAPAAKQERKYPYLLNTGRLRDQWHTMTRTGLAPRLMAHQDEPYVELHPHDAMKLGVGAGDLVRVQTIHAAAVMRAKVTDGQRVGEIFAPMHWTDRFGSSGPVDRLVTGIPDPLSGQPELKTTAVRLAPIPTLWRGLLIGGAETLSDAGFCHARIPTDAGVQIYEMRGWAPLPETSTIAGWATQFIGEGAERIEIVDPLHGTYRFAVIADGRLKSCLMPCTKAQFPLPGRADLLALIGQPTGPAEREMLGAITESAEAAPPKSTVCVCFGIDCTQIETAIRTGRLTTAAEIGVALKAGTNCGSCIPELREILRGTLVSA